MKRFYAFPAVGILCLLALSPAAAQSGDPLSPLEAHMFHWISGSAMWRSPNLDYDPKADAMTMPWIKEYGVNWRWSPDRTHMIGEILAYPAEAKPILSATMYAFYNSVTHEVLQVHVARNGNLIMSTDAARSIPTPFGVPEVSDATDFAANGTQSVTRHANTFVDERTQLSDVLSQQADGSFELLRQWRWTKIPE